MTESYTINDTGSISCNWQNRGSQSFTPTETHELQYVDLTIKPFSCIGTPYCRIYLADAQHKPTGDALIHAYKWDYPHWVFGFRKRCRFYFNPILLEKDVEYCVVLYGPDTLPPTDLRWYYNAGAGGYTRGCRSFSTDFGASWTVYPNDDFMFVEFGIPPLVDLPAAPPIANFSVLDVEQEVTATGIKFTVLTNVPCFLVMYWTAFEPDKHVRAIERRGFFWKDQVKFCFVNWHQNEQEEASDTLIHTFTKEPWPHCQTRWFTFRAKVDGVWSNSCGPIFKKHRVEPEVPPCIPETLVFTPNNHPEVSSVDGWVARLISAGVSWTVLRLGAGTHAFDDTTTLQLQVGQADDSLNLWRVLTRLITLFDISAIPAGSTIQSAFLSLYQTGKSDLLGIHDSFYIGVYESYPNSNIVLVPADYGHIHDVCLTDSPLLWDDGVQNAWNDIPLNAAGIAVLQEHFNTTGIAKLGLREKTYDADGAQPPWIALKHTNWLCASAEGTFDPKLSVTFCPP